METAFPQIAFEMRRKLSVAVQIAEPFAKLRVGKVFETLIVDFLVHFGRSCFASEFPGQNRGNFGFIMRLPNLNIVPVFGDRPAVCLKGLENQRENSELN